MMPDVLWIRTTLSVLLLLLALAEAASAQAGRFEVSGTVVDSTGAALSGATVMVLETDSTLISFGITRPDGTFRLGRVPAGEMVLQVTFVGFESYTRPLTLTDRSVDVGTVVLEEAVDALDELVVTADHIPLLVRRDTLDYNAAAFRVPPNANVEALLRRLPGIEIGPDGTIRAQGEAVSRVLVDGREFFGSDPTVATRNLPADAVDRVQVYDRLSDAAELTGVDDGRHERTINLQLREDRRTGTFGNLAGGLGDPQRFEARGSVNRFRPGAQLSLIGNANNINQQGFQQSDYLSFMGGPGRATFNQRLVPISFGPSDGFSTTLSGGVNFNTDLGPRTSLRTSYVAYYLDRERDMVALQRELAGGQSAALVAENNDVNDRQRSHRLQLNATHEFSDGHDLRFVTNANIGGTASESERFRATERPQGATQNTNLRHYDWTSNALTADAHLTYRRRLSPGRAFVAEARSSGTGSRLDTDLLSTSRFFQAGDLLTTEEVRQIQDQSRNLLDHRQRLTYTEPLGRRQLLQFEVEHQAVLEDRDYATFDIVDGDPLLNVPQSLAFDRTYRYFRGGATFRRSVDPLTLSVGAVLQRAGLYGETIGEAAGLDRGFVRVLPSASLRYAFSQGHHLQLHYAASTREPTLRDLQPFVDASDPLNVYVGNPELRPAYQHAVWGNYVFFDLFTSTSLFANARFSYNANAIVPSRFIDENLRQTRTVVNTDGDWTLNLWASFGRPVRPLGVRANLSANPTLSRGVEFVNAEANASNIMRTAVTLSVDNLDKEALDVRGGATYTFNAATYTLNPALDQSYVNRTLFGSVEYEFAPGWRVLTALDYHLYSADVFGAERRVPLLRSHLSWMPPRTRAELRLEGHDLLDQNLGVSFTNTASHVREQRTASLGRFVMLKMVYNLSGQPATPTRVIRVGG